MASALAAALLAALPAGCVCKSYDTQAVMLTRKTTTDMHPPIQWTDQRFEFDHEIAGVVGSQSFGGTLTRLRLRGDDLTLSPSAAQASPPGTPADPWGIWESDAIDVAGGFTELLPSWNVVLPTAGDGRLLGWADFTVRVRDAADGTWSDWLWVGGWGGVPDGLRSPVKSAHGRVDIDILTLHRPADAFAIRARLCPAAADEADALTSETIASPRLRRVVVVTSAPGDQVESSTKKSTPKPVNLDVPFMAQGWNPEPLWPRTCSPTATGMVMAYRGVELTTLQHAEGVYDAQHDIYGNWGRAVAWAGQHGLRCELARMRSWEQVAAHLHAGQPVIASIRFEAGAFPSNPMKSTDGHIIVVRGITDDGHIIVNDPASAEHGHGIIYHRDELAAAWFANGGVAYLIGPAPPGTDR